MKLHIDTKTFKEFLNKISIESNIDLDILEKDYYVCCILKQLSSIQDELKAYFKGGTALYKIIQETRRFSEDIDLMVVVDDNISKNQNRKRREKATFNYDIPGLVLDSQKNEKNGMNSTAVYKYESVFDISSQPLYRAGIIKVESTSFTVSEPVSEYSIEPLIYKLASEENKNVLSKIYDVSPIKIKIIKLERIFIDKIFAAEFYNIRNDFAETSKHIYDICVLFNEEIIQNLLTNKEYLKELIDLKRREELKRTGGIDENLKISEFKYLKEELKPDFIKEFDNMQNKYIIKDEYKISIDKCKKVLNNLIEIFKKYQF